MKTTESIVKDIFSHIANKYDLVNAIASLGTHSHWNKRFIEIVLGLHRPQNVLDLCCGTANITKALLDEMRTRHLTIPTIDCVDFCPQMLQEAQKKLFNESALIRFLRADATCLPVANETYDTIISSYSIQNIYHREKAFEEISRVLKPSGKLFLLELTKPFPMLSPFIKIYLYTILPLIGGLLTRQWKAYAYLGSAVYSLRSEDLVEQLQNNGFHCKKVVQNSFGFLTFLCAEKL